MQRREFLKGTSVALAATLTGCGGGETGGAPSANASPSPAPAPPPAPGPGAVPLSGGLPVLTLHPTKTVSGPYTAAVYPLEGLVPGGQDIDSPDDPTLRSSVLSRWPDGSAAVVVVAGETSLSVGASKQIRLRAGSASQAALTPARIGQLLSNVTIDCAGVGAAVFTDFSVREKQWWANERVICCRYRKPIGTHPTLEAVIDIHAFSSGRAWVEVVVENCKMATANPAMPPSAAYSATLSVNGAAMAAVSTAGAPGAAHQPFRAWYASGWVGGDPGIDVTHDTAAMQLHPLFFRVWKSGGSMATYAADAYQPWGVGRHPAHDMGAGGDSAFIGPLPAWEVQYLQTGDNQVRRAVIASALSVLSFGVNYRDAGTGLVPTFDQLANRNQQQFGYDPARAWLSNGAEPAWEVAHHPAAGLMAFMCRPSPAFIEIAQKVAVWNGTWSSDDGTFGAYYQTRGKAWCIRSLTHAIFLTPDSDAWKRAGGAALFRNARLLKTFQDDPKATLGFVWDYAPGNLYDFNAVFGGTGFIQPLWQHHYLVTELHKAASAKLLAGTEQATLSAIADWAAAQPVRYVNEASAGEWRILYYQTPVGRNAATIDSLPTWSQQFAWFYADAPPPAAGPWLTGNWKSTTYASASPDSSAGAYYPSYFWSALVAAVERGVAGSAAAWSKVTANVTNLSTWSDGFGPDPRWGAYPRNK
ncbi:MAG: hypothetical protein ABJA83_13295 [Burkholderiaceae bacterium]